MIFDRDFVVGENKEKAILKVAREFNSQRSALSKKEKYKDGTVLI